ncbi:hypothetical protein [Bosea sp. OAE506]|uniref:DUF5343 domain-containing protein n=1 Tax=Bosea sp. OAE506 TaxID=2663870 RepID=UPI00339356A5
MSKKVGFANLDGTPSDLYKKFRNPALSGEAVASIIKLGMVLCISEINMSMNSTINR